MIRQALMAAALMGAMTLQAGLITSHADGDTAGATLDGVIDIDEYGVGNTYSFTGAGSGFGSTIGGATMYMQSDATTLYFGFEGLSDPGSNQILIYFNTRTGGYSTEPTDINGMDDFSDAGRANISRLAGGANAVERIPFEADFALLWNMGFTFLAELADTGPHSAVSHSVVGLGTPSPEFSVSLASLGMSAGDTVQFAAYLISDTGYLSDEGLPSTGLVGNPGFNDNNTINFADYHEFQTVPEPGTLAFGAIGLIGLAARHLRRRTA